MRSVPDDFEVGAVVHAGHGADFLERVPLVSATFPRRLVIAYSHRYARTEAFFILMFLGDIKVHHVAYARRPERNSKKSSEKSQSKWENGRGTKRTTRRKSKHGQIRRIARMFVARVDRRKIPQAKGRKDGPACTCAKSEWSCGSGEGTWREQQSNEQGEAQCVRISAQIGGGWQAGTRVGGWKGQSPACERQRGAEGMGRVAIVLPQPKKAMGARWERTGEATLHKSRNQRESRAARKKSPARRCA